MQRRCCCPPERDRALFFQLVLHLIPKRGASETGFHDIVAVALMAVESGRPGDILVNAFGEGIGFLENHADMSPYRYGIDRGTVDVFGVKEHLALCRGAGYELVHSVEGPERRAFPAAGRADYGGHRLSRKGDGEFLNGDKTIGVNDIQLLGGKGDMIGGELQGVFFVHR